MTRININLPSHVVCQLFFALRRVGGMRHGPIRHHGQRRSVFERLGPRVRRSAVNGSGCGRIFASAVRNLRQDARRGRRWSSVHRGRQASPLAPRLQSQPPSPRRGVDGAGPSNVAPQAVEAPAPPVVEAPAPPVDKVVAVPMEPMSPALPPPPPRFWCDFCKEFTPIPHTLEYSYSLPAPTPAQVAVPGGALDPWYLATQAAPPLVAVKEEAIVATPGVGFLNVLQAAACALRDPVEAAARMANCANPTPAARGPLAPAATMAEGSASTPPSIQHLLGRRVAAVDRRPGIRRRSWNPAALNLPSAEVLNMGAYSNGFNSSDVGESSSN